MAVHVDWYDSAATIILHEFVGDVTVNDCFVGARAGRALLATVPHRVDAIVDFSRALPPTVKLLAVLPDLEAEVMANLGALHVVIEMSYCVKTAVVAAQRMAPRLLGGRLYVVATRHDALANIRRLRARSGNSKDVPAHALDSDSR